jgi:hypothetical protein
MIENFAVKIYVLFPQTRANIAFNLSPFMLYMQTELKMGFIKE